MNVVRTFVTMTVMALTMNTFNAEGQTIREFPLSNDDSPFSITAGPDGNYWFTEDEMNRIGRMSPQGELILRDVPTLNSSPEGIVAGPDGNLWFVEAASHQIGRITVDGIITEFLTRCAPSGFIINGPDDSVWFSESCGDEDYIGQVSTGDFAGGVFEHYIGSKKGLRDLAWGKDGNIWFVESTQLAIGFLNKSGTVIDSIVPSADSSSLTRLAVIEDGDIWFPNNSADKKLARCTISGFIDEFAWPLGSPLGSIASGSDGNIWLTDSGDSSLWKVDISGSLPTSTQYFVPSSVALGSITSGFAQQMLFVDASHNFVDESQNHIGVVYLDGIFRNDFESH